MWDYPTMITVKSDDKQRVTIPGAGLKRVFQVERPNEDTWILTRLAPPKITRAKITSRKVDGFTVFSCGRTVQQAEIRKLLDVFP